MFYPSRVLSKSPCFGKILTIYFDKIVTKTQKLFFGHKSVLKLKNWRKQNQPGIKFYNIECVEFIFETFLTDLSQKLDFPYFQLFQILGQNFFGPKVTQPRVFKLSVPGGLRIFRAFASLLDISEVNRKAIYRTRSAGQNLSQYIGCTREAKIRPQIFQYR